MIHLEIISGPDKDTQMKFQFFQNEIYLGKSSGNLHIKDPDLLPYHAMIEVIGTDLIFHPQKGVDFYLIDGKRAAAVRKIKPELKITIGQTTFKVLAFEETDLPSKKNVLDTKLAKLVEENSTRVIAVEKLAKLMK